MSKLSHLTALLLPAIVAMPVQAASPPVAALAYRPDGKQLAAAQGNEVALIDSATGAVTNRVTAGSMVTALAWSLDGGQLAIATGLPAKTGEIRILGRDFKQAPLVIPAHTDLIYGLAFSPDGKWLASSGYDRLVKLLETATGKEIRTLKDHSDTVYGIACRPDGKLLASVGADRAVKVWDEASGVRLYTLGDATDWVYTVAWHPDGKHLAAAGVDKSIRVWEINEKEGRLVHSAFAHEKPVLRIAYSSDGKTLYSLSEDRTVKIWDAEKLTEIKVFPAQPESVLSLALRPDGKQVALGRYDGVCLLLDGDGKVLQQPLPEKPKPPKINSVTPNAAPAGSEVQVSLTGEHLGEATQLLTTIPGAKARLAVNKAIITLAPNTEPGAYQLKLNSPAGESNGIEFFVDRFPAKPEPAGNDSPATAPEISLQQTIVGALSRAGEVDCFHIKLTKGQEVGVQSQIPPSSKLEPVLTLTDAAGVPLRATTNGSLGFKCQRAGVYVLALRDREYRGGTEFTYRIHVGDVPVVTSIFPLGLQRGAEIEVQVEGVNLGSARTAKIKAPPDAGIGSRVALPLSTPKGKPLGNLNLVIGEFPESGIKQALSVPGTANGTIGAPHESQSWQFEAKKGQPLIVEIDARRLGSPLDSVIEILDVNGKPVERAVLRSLAKTFVTFRDHDSAGSGIRMETWNEFAMDDYVLVGQELMRIRDLPKNPDDDCQFYAVNGQRVGYLGTTPTHHALNTPMFKVGIFPPGSVFPPNGMPIVTLPYRNDDGGPGYGKDSRLRFDPPGNGVYQVRVSDARGMAGVDFAYRLTVRPPRPDFTVRFNPTSPSVWKGGAIPITVTADRKDDFDGTIQVKVDNLPTGFSAPPSFIEAGQTSTSFALFADAGAIADAKRPGLKLVASAQIDGKMVTHEALGGVPNVVEPGDIITTVSQESVTIRPGREARLLVHVERRNGFKGRIPLEVSGLPHGVRVLNIGLNGILVTERDTSREIVIYAEPWVQPMEHPFVVLAKREGKSTDHAAKSVLLKIER